MPLLPDVTINIQDGGIGAANPDAGQLQVVMGVSSGGSLLELTPKLVSSPAKLIETFGYGPTVDAAAMAISVGLAPVIFVKLPATNAGTNTSVTAGGGNTSTSTVTVTGVPYDTYDVIVKVTVAASIGDTDPAPQVKYSLDGGVTYSASTRVTGAATATLLLAGATTGLTLNFGAGTLVLGDTFTFQSTEPKWAASDVQDGIDALAAGNLDFGFIHLVGKCDESEAATFDGNLEILSENSFKYCSMLVNTRDFEGDDEDAWMSAIVTDFTNFDDTRIGVCAGAARLTSVLHNWVYRRPISFAAAARGSRITLHSDLGRVKDGSIRQLGQDNNGVQIYHDESANPGLDLERFITTRSIVGLNGAYFTQSPLMAPSGSDFYTWPNRRVMDLICKTARRFFITELNDSVLVNPVTGFILEKEARDLEARSDAAQRDAVLAPGHVSAVKTTISRSDNILSTKTLTVSISAIPVGYKKFINVTIGFTNPAISLG